MRRCGCQLYTSDIHGNHSLRSRAGWTVKNRGDRDAEALVGRREDGRQTGDGAAVVTPLRRLIDHDGDDDAGLTRRRHTDKTRHVLIDVFAVFNFVGRPGFPGIFFSIQSGTSGSILFLSEYAFLFTAGIF